MYKPLDNHNCGVFLELESSDQKPTRQTASGQCHHQGRQRRQISRSMKHPTD